MSPAALLIASFGCFDLRFVHTGKLIGSAKTAPVGIAPSSAKWASARNQSPQGEGNLEVFAHKPDDAQDHSNHSQSTQNAPDDLWVDGNGQGALFFFGVFDLLSIFS